MRAPLPHHLTAGGFFVPGNQPHLGDLAAPFTPTRPILSPGFTSHVTARSTSLWGDLADVFESQHRRKALCPHHPCRQTGGGFRAGRHAETGAAGGSCAGRRPGDRELSSSSVGPVAGL